MIVSILWEIIFEEISSFRKFVEMGWNHDGDECKVECSLGNLTFKTKSYLHLTVEILNCFYTMLPNDNFLISFEKLSL